MCLSSTKISSVLFSTTSTPASLARSSATTTRRGGRWSWRRRPRASGRLSTPSSEACSSIRCTPSLSVQKLLFSRLPPSGPVYIFSTKSVCSFRSEWFISSICRYMHFWKGYHCRWNPKLRSQDSIHQRYLGPTYLPRSGFNLKCFFDNIMCVVWQALPVDQIERSTPSKRAIAVSEGNQT